MSDPTRAEEPTVTVRPKRVTPGATADSGPTSADAAGSASVAAIAPKPATDSGAGARGTAPAGIAPKSDRAEAQAGIGPKRAVETTPTTRNAGGTNGRAGDE